jgi:hypothetical protein
MPWCEDCARFWNPPSLRDGSCPTCGTLLVTEAPEAEARAPRAPWHFKLLLVALVIYLGYRGYQGVVWVGHSWLHVF